MLLVRARKGPSPIHGFGLIAEEPIPRGTVVWRFRPAFDLAIPEADLADYPPAVAEQIHYYAYWHVPRRTYLLSGDDDRFSNSAADPVTRVAGDRTVAVRDIPAGGEITFDYDDPQPIAFGPEPSHSHVYVAPCDLGLGTFAAEPIRRGEPVLRFDGSIISLAGAIAKNEAEANPLQVGDERYVDLVSPGVFINHSCEPNAGIADDRTLIALRDLHFGEEVRFDYSTTMWEEMWTMPCHCGGAGCRGVVEDFVRLPAATRERYLRLGVVQRFIVERLRGDSLREAAHVASFV